MQSGSGLRQKGVPFLEGDDFGCFFIIGAQKAGTTSLYHYLASHPDVYATAQKEPRFFLAPNPTPRARREYAALFAGRTSQRWVFEASTGYSRYPARPGVPGRIREMAPNARFIYLLRHPVERVLSAYRHNLAQGRERRPIREALRDDGWDYLDRSRYHMQLQQYLAVFPRDRILVLFFEDLVERQRQTLNRVFRFLEISADVNLSTAGKRFNDSSTKRVPGTLLRALSAIPGYERLPARVRKYCAERWSHPVPPRSELITPDLYNSVLQWLDEDIDRLKTLLEDDLRIWNLERL
jgi:hypothetical protein